jgi:glycosyltransferase involved in cell wall biosynthesis
VRIAISAYDRSSSGISTYTLELAKLLSKDVRLSLIAFDDVEIPGVEVLPIRSPLRLRALPILTFLRSHGEVAEALRGYDVVHETLSPWGSSAERLVITRWGYVSYPELVRIRTVGISFPENLGALPITLQQYLMYSASRRRAIHVIDVSSESPNFVPPMMEPGRPKDYGCSGRLRLLFVSWDLGVPRKNLRIVLEALRLVRAPVELHLVGGGRIPGRPPVPTVSHGLLPREGVMALMREVDLLVLPSTYEELGFVGLEAYSVGLPVITSDIPSFRAVYRPSPKFPPGDPRALAGIIDGLSCGELERLGRSELEHLRAMNEAARRKLMAIYRRVLESRD